MIAAPPPAGTIQTHLDINARLATEWPLITAARDPLPEADEWANVKDKKHYLFESA